MYNPIKFLFALILMVLTFYAECKPSVFVKNPGSTAMRAPAYPLITIDPYTCAWSTTDQLFDSPVSHWTGKTHGLIGAIRVDGKVYRFLGKESVPTMIIAPMATQSQWVGKFTTQTPAEGWNGQIFNNVSWETGKGAFGTKGAPALATLWKTKDIWVRREIDIPQDLTTDETYLTYSHDDNVEIYLNGNELVNSGFTTGNNIILKIDNSLLLAGKKNILAAHCQNPMGGGLLDFGLFQQREKFLQTAVQKSVSLSATKTHYEFSCGPVDLALDFVSPLLPEDLDLMSRPVNYVNYEIVSNDRKTHDVQIYFEITPEWAVNENGQEVNVISGETGGIKFAKAGTTDQPVLQKSGDDVRIDWGHVYLATVKTAKSTIGIGDYFETKESFIQKGKVSQNTNQIISIMTKHMPAMAFVDQVGTVSGIGISKGYLMVAYDDQESIQYFDDNLKAWWTKDGSITINNLLKKAADEHNAVMDRCSKFDRQLWDETVKAGGKNYADLCVLAFRQSIAAHKLVKDHQGNLLFLSKENFSNGSIGTVDVTYPSAPLFLRYNPELLKGMLNPIFHFSESGKWTKPFPSHDVGTYPLANGQTYGGDMPVEESGNMLILVTAIAHAEGNAEYAKKHWDVLTIWADYLLEHGLNPENQLCTDDFAGHQSHNVNLSVKAITAIAGYGLLAQILGKNEIAKKYTAEAKRMGKEWVRMADDGDHYRLTFDQSGTWSQKYNMVWDNILKLDIFPKEVARKEVAYYLSKQNKYGLPLDNRKDYTKSDWIVWSATMAGDIETFQKFIDPLHLYITETPNRVPMSDWFGTKDAVKTGFQARSVVGAYFIKLLK